MKRILILAALLTGCDTAPPPAPTPDLRPIAGTGIGFAPHVFLDSDTGCHYLSTHTSAALTPRIAADGKTHLGCKGARP